MLENIRETTGFLSLMNKIARRYQEITPNALEQVLRDFYGVCGRHKDYLAAAFYGNVGIYKDWHGFAQRQFRIWLAVSFTDEARGKFANFAEYEERLKRDYFAIPTKECGRIAVFRRHIILASTIIDIPIHSA